MSNILDRETYKDLLFHSTKYNSRDKSFKNNDRQTNDHNLTMTSFSNFEKKICFEKTFLLEKGLKNIQKIESKLKRQKLKIIKDFGKEKKSKIHDLNQNQQKQKIKIRDKLIQKIFKYSVVSKSTETLEKHIPQNKIIGTIRCSGFKNLSKSLKEFASRFYQQVQLEFSDTLELKFQKIYCSKKVNLQNDNLHLYIEKIQKQSDLEFLNSLGFETNYDIILSNLFSSDLKSKSDWLQKVSQVLIPNLKKWFISKIRYQKDSQKNCFEAVLRLFLTHLNIPDFLIEKLDSNYRLSLLILILSFIIKLKFISKYFDEKQINMLIDDSLIDIDFENTSIEKKKVYFFCWYLKKILDNFQNVLKLFRTKSSMNLINQALKDLFTFENVNQNRLNLKQKLSSIVSSINLNQLQQFFIFVKNQFVKKKDMCQRFSNQQYKRVYFYYEGKQKKNIQISLQLLNQNNFFLDLLPNLPAKSFVRNIKKPKEMCLFFGSRLKKFVVRQLNQNAQKDSNQFLTVFDETQKNKKMQNWNKIEADQKEITNHYTHLFQKMLSFAKISKQMLRSIKETDRFAPIFDSFLKSFMIQNELLKFFHKSSGFNKKIVNPGCLLRRLSTPTSKAKSPLSVVDLLNTLVFVESL